MSDPLIKSCAHKTHQRTAGSATSRFGAAGRRACSSCGVSLFIAQLLELGWGKPQATGGMVGNQRVEGLSK